MRPTTQLNTERLKYYREQRDFTQAALSKAIFRSLRYYQRVEASGCTSPETAGRLATALGVTQEAIKSANPLSQDDTAIDLVWIESVNYAFGGLLIALTAGLDELDTWLSNAAKSLIQQEIHSGELPKLVVRTSPDGIEFRLHLPSRPASDPYQKLKQSFLLQPAVKESHGVNWITFKQNDLDWLARHVWLAAGNSADKVEFNGQDVPQTEDCPYAIILHGDAIRALNCGPPEPDLQIVETERDFLRAFRRLRPRADSASGLTPQLLRCTATDHWSLRVTNLPGRLSRKHIEVCRVERLGEGTVRRIPWARPYREHLVSFIESNHSVLVVHEGEPDVIFAPNLLAGSVLL